MIQLEVWGNHALFSRPELKTERVSYDVPTPSAAKGIVESIFYHPGLKWKISRIYILNPTRFVSIQRNEIKDKISCQTVRQAAQGKSQDLYLSTSQSIVQRSSLLLKNVHYVIEAHFEMTSQAAPSDNPGKFQDITIRRMEKGQCFHTPYLGCREFPAAFRRWPGGTIETNHETRDLGLMLYDFDYSDPQNIQPTYFRAKLEDGVLDLRDCEVLR